MKHLIKFYLSSLMIILSLVGSASADHVDSFSGHHKSQEVSYDSSEMTRFFILKQARERKDLLMDSLSRWPEQKVALVHNLTHDRGLGGLIALAGVFSLMMLSGFLIEKIAGFKLNRVCIRLTQSSNDTWGDSLNLLLIRSAFQFVGLGIFVFVAGAVATYVFGDEDPFRILSLHALGLVMKIRAMAIVLSFVFAPYSEGLRLIKMENSAAKKVYFSILLFVSSYLFITTAWRLLALFSLEPIMFSMLVPLSGLILNISSVIFIWYLRHDITRMFTTKDQHDSQFIQVFRQSWPTLLTFWLLVIWSIWAANEFLGNYEQAERLTPAWWLTFSYPILDRIVFVLMTQLKRISWLQSHTFEQRCDIFIRRVIIAIRIIVITAILYLIDSSFGYNAWQVLTTSLGDILIKSVDIVQVVIIAYAIWEVIQSAIERHLPHEIISEDDGLSSLEGEGGGAGASRSETLLPLVRSFMLFFLLSSLVLTVLNILGVEIAPLLAGAGIVGIAVGFGAQKLVQDVISGIFFLLDDAFRRGEYIEAAGLRGTVERISIRSIRLRHHLGAVQTIPFGEIATVRNLSRDWITMKLEFRLDYRTDVEKVRKLIKKVGQSMLEHPEYGKHFLLPLKSQGVIRVEESALIFRMKFTCVPGEQWVIRRDAFRLVKDSLKSNGIEFAHRSVHVLMQANNDEKETPTPSTDIQNALAGAAASSAATNASEKVLKNDRIDHMDD